MTSQSTIAGQEKFESPTFLNRLKSMLKLDFYRLFHTPAFYIMLLFAAIIPAMVLGMSGMEPPAVTNTHSVSAAPSAPAIAYTNTWQLIESAGGSAAADNPMDFSGYANINMLFIFAGLLISIFVSHDYSSGFVKNIFAVHSKKTDYVLSKSAVGLFSGAGMIITYVLGTVLSGWLAGKSFDVNGGGLILCLISKLFLMGVFCPLFLGVAVFFRNRLWLTIVFTFLLGMMFYPAASAASLNATVITVLMSFIAGAGGAAAFGSVSNLILKRRDLA